MEKPPFISHKILSSNYLSNTSLYMKNHYLFIALLFSSILSAQIVNIPDVNFKQALVGGYSTTALPVYTISATSGYNWAIPNLDTPIDANFDGQIQVSEAQAITYLDVRNLNIASLTGIEAFTNLR